MAGRQFQCIAPSSDFIWSAFLQVYAALSTHLCIKRCDTKSRLCSVMSCTASRGKPVIFIAHYVVGGFAAIIMCAPRNMLVWSAMMGPHRVGIHKSSRLRCPDLAKPVSHVGTAANA